MKQYALNKDQFNALEGLCYWIANLSITLERYPDDKHEIKRCRDTIEKSCFPACDALNIPFYIQNSAVFFADDWKRYKTDYLQDYLKTRNIIVE